MKTILLVDDEPDLLQILSETLVRCGYRVIPHADAESALTVVAGEPVIDLVITDFRLPGMSGLEFVAMLRKTLPHAPVIMLTGYGTVESYLTCRSNGVFEYLNKPVQAKELRRIVKAALDWSQNGRPDGLPSLNEAALPAS